MIFFDKIRTIGQDANGKNVVWVSIYVDTAANLPSYNDYQSDGFILCMSSEGRCIDTGDLYRLDSAGAWQISQAGTGTYTKSEIDNLLSAKQNVLTFDSTPTQNSTNPVTSGGIWTDQQRQDALQTEDRAALIEIVDGGAKNLLYYTKVGTSVESGSQYLSNGVRFTIQSDGSVLVNRESSNANEAFCNLRLDSSSQFIDDYCNGQYVLAGSYGDCILRATNNTYNAIDTAGNGVVLRDRGSQTSIWVQIRVSASASPNNVAVKPMICSKAAWKISQDYQP